jgi:cephalosporin hydroxylase
MNILESVESAVKLCQAGKFLQAQLACYQILEHNPKHHLTLCLLGKINYALTRNKAVPVDAGLGYHLWYYYSTVWTTTCWAGVKVEKPVCDLWNYQEIIFDLKPNLIVEFGTLFGGSALFLSSVLRQLGRRYRVLSVDINHDSVSPKAREDPNIDLMLSSSTSPDVARRINELCVDYPGPTFAILDSDHHKNHVFAEMLLLRPILKTGDYLVVEDGNINGHPVLPAWGEGPYEALQEYFTKYPDDYKRDRAREHKFDFTFAPAGFLIRR